MGFSQKRKRCWGSKIFFGLRHAKVLLIEKLPPDDGNEVASRPGALDGLIERSNSEDAKFNAVTSAKMRRTGSKILSIVRFSRLSGTCLSF
jgi:hypothetical protein